MQCSSIPQDVFESDAVESCNRTRKATSSAISQAAQMATPKKIHEVTKASAIPPSPQPLTTVRRWRPADVGLEKENLSTTIASALLNQDAIVVGPVLLSLGPRSDAVIDRYKLGDKSLPKLRALVGSVRSSKWKQALRSPPYNLTFEQASNLAHALHADLQGTQSAELTKVSNPKCIQCTRLYGILGRLNQPCIS